MAGSKNQRGLSHRRKPDSLHQHGQLLFPMLGALATYHHAHHHRSRFSSLALRPLQNEMPRQDLHQQAPA